jgi:hypothetical protein
MPRTLLALAFGLVALPAMAHAVDDNCSVLQRYLFLSLSFM